MTYQELMFQSHGDRCSAWHFPGEGERFARGAGRPIVVMGHGFGGTKDAGLQPFAERISAAGIDVFAFDYRGFGASEGYPRQTISITRQMEDYQAAILEAQLLPGVDRNRVVLWGSSFSGSHVIRVGSGRDDIAAVIAMTPMTSGLAVSKAAVAHRDVLSALKWTALGAASRIRVARGGQPVLMPLAAKPGEPGALALDGAYESYTAMAGPTWRNEVDSSVGMQVLSVRTSAAAKKLRAALLVQIADFDRYVPADSVAKTAVHGRAQVHHYPCDHFDVWPGHEWFSPVVDDQVRFLTRTLGAKVDAPISTA